MDAVAELRDVQERLARLEKALGGGEPYLTPAEVAINGVLRLVAYRMSVAVHDIVGPRRHARLFRARCAICWIVDQLGCASLTPTGRMLGQRDHTTIMNAIKRGEDMRRRDSAFRALTDEALDHFRKGFR